MPSTTSQTLNIAEEINLPITFSPVSENIKTEEIYGLFTPDPKLVRRNDIAKLGKEWISKFNSLLSSGNFEDHIDKVFLPNASWRDHMCLSWDLHQFHGVEKILTTLNSSQRKFNFHNVTIDTDADKRVPSGVSLVTIHEADTTEDGFPIEWVQVLIQFETAYGSGKGVVRLVPTTSGLFGYTVFTSLDQLFGNEEKLRQRRPRGVNHGQNVNRLSWLDQRRADTARYTSDSSDQPTVLIIGGGQSGLNMAARFKMMGIDLLIIEKNPRIGDNWRNRYSFLVLHDPIYLDHLLYMEFPDIWPIYTPKDKLAGWFEYYVEALELDAWTGSCLVGAKFDKSEKIWTCDIKDVATNRVTTLSPKHVIMATGHSGEANVPHFANEENFHGVIVHSSKHSTGKLFSGEKALVVGSCNSAHDIAQDFYEQGAQVTMVQRSSTCVMNVNIGSKLNLAGIYEENGPGSTETADLLNFSSPIPLTNRLQQQIVRQTYVQEKPMIDALTSKGFKLDYGYGGTGMYGKYFRRGGGYYIDVGGSSLIVQDKIKMKQGAEISRFTESGVIFDDGTSIEDVAIVVLATGYLNMRTTALKLFGEEVAKDLKPAWGLDEEGELNAVFRESGHENFWYAGGNLTVTRYLSKKLAFRIIAQERNLI